jgi:hypothetical protein
LCTQCAEIADKESTATVLARISAIHDEIVAVSAQIMALGDISTLRSDVSTNTENIGTLNTRTTGLLDYVIESQAPTAENNYTWYRKYKSGWVEQGGVQSGSVAIAQGGEGNLGVISLPITMQDAHYCAVASGDAYTTLINVILSTTTCKFAFGAYSANRTLTRVCWYICGMAAS